MKKLFIIILIMVLGVGGFFIYLKFFAAGKDELPKAALTLVESTDNPKVLPHAVETQTYFENSIVYLTEEAAPPTLFPAVPVDANASNRASTPKPEIEVSLPEPDWNGIVLIPDMKVMSKAYNASVTLPRVEAHPLNDNHIRVWARIKNETNGPLRIQVSCSFRIEGSLDLQPSGTQKLILRKDSYTDVKFDSPSDGVLSYTVLVK